MSKKNQVYKIIKYTDAHRNQLLKVWEESVSATHSFLTPGDFQSIKELVKTINFNDFEVYCLIQNNDDCVVGFLGVASQKLEMLFLSPSVIGNGLGKRMLDFAIDELRINKVDVNEQNAKAVEFYQKYGFKTYARTDKDDQGMTYPLLRMKLEGK